MVGGPYALATNVLVRSSGLLVLLVCVVGCTVAPAAVPATPPPVATATAVPAATPTAPAVAQPTPTAATEPAAQPAAAPVLPAAAPVLPPAAPPDPPVVGGALPDGTIPTAAQPVADPACDGGSPAEPLPAPGSPRAQDFFRSFRDPLPPAPLYTASGPRRVGLQAGHWLTDQVPPELGRLQGGAVGGGKQEWEINLDVARRTARLLEAAGVEVDVMPSTVPPRYRAHAFIALHADGDPAGAARGFKIARPGFSSVPDVDDRLVETLNQVYGADTELPRDDEHISLRMRYYYAFNSRRYCHAVAPGVPQAIVEMGYLTSAADRQSLIGNPDRLASALARGIRTFLSSLP